MVTERIIGKSAAWLEAMDHVSQLALINRAAIIVGERGTGKELIAERLHFLSPRWDQPFVKVNCAGFTDSLLESELFGYEPGAFTGATRLHHGRFERAQGGTLFLDELGTLSARVQEKVLRIIEYGEFERLGGQKTLAVDVRIVAATNADLKSMAQRNEFRSDLLDRLAFDVVHPPPLRQRREDIGPLAVHFAVRMSHELGWPLFPGFTAAAEKVLLDYQWPGNVRELKNVVERSVYRWGNEAAAIDAIVIDPFIPPQTFDTPVSASSAQPDTEPLASPHPKPANFTRAVEEFEKTLLARALQEEQHHQGRAAEKLGLSYHQFRGLYRKYQLGNDRG